MLEIKKYTSDWRLINLPPRVGQNVNGYIILMLLFSILAGFAVGTFKLIQLTFLVLILDVVRIKLNLWAYTEVFAYFINRLSPLKSSINTRGLYYLPLFIITFYSGNSWSDIKVNYAKPVAQELFKKPKSGSPDNIFIDNERVINGAGKNVQLPIFLEMILPNVFNSQYKSVELKKMEIDWYSIGWTTDQILGNIAIRYGLMFELMEGSPNIVIGWRDEKACSDKSKKDLTRRMCGRLDSTVY